MNAIYEKNIMHRDLNINNVMLHFSDLEPTLEEMQDPGLLDKLSEKKFKKI